MKPKIIFIADDHELVANGIASLLNQLGNVLEIKIFPNGKLLFQQLFNQKPTHILLDIEMPEWDGIHTLQEIKKSAPEIPVLMLSMLNEPFVIQDCINKGASAYLNKDSTVLELQTAFETIEKGEIFYSSEVKKALEGKLKIRTTSNLELTDPLTEREIDVLRLLCDGLTSKEIAEKLFLSSRTIETHKNNIMQKFNVNSTGKLIMLAIKNRIVK